MALKLGVVDGQDFQIWQRGFGSAGTIATGDADGSGFVDAADLAIWQSQYGNVSESLVASSAAVPEPTALGLLTAGFVTLFSIRRQSF